MTDHTLKKLFDEARRQDASNTPGFQRVLRKQAVATKDSPAFGWMPLAFAAALLVDAALLAFSVLPKNETHTAEEIEQWAAISDWTMHSLNCFGTIFPKRLTGSSLRPSRDRVTRLTT